MFQSGQRIFILAINLCFVDLICAYSIPTPRVEPLSPKGLRISIPDEPGIVIFAVHGAVGRELSGQEQGDFSGEIESAVNGRWSYENKKVFFETGDTVYFWVHVQHERVAYKILNARATVLSDGSVRVEGPGISSVTQPIGPVTDRPPTESPPIHPPIEPPTRQPPIIGPSQPCVESITQVRGRNVCRGELIFEDDFDTLDWSKWSREVRIPLDRDDADFVSFQSRPENCYVSNGKLFIVPNLLTEVSGFNDMAIRRGLLDLGNECTGTVDIAHECRRQAKFSTILPPIVSARIRTKNSFSFMYGRIEIRAKLPTGDWLFPQIFLEPQSNVYGVVGYASGQIRVAFIRSNEILESAENLQIDGHRLSGGVVLTPGEPLRETWLKSKFSDEHWAKNYHVYSLTWTDQSISLAVDNETYAVIPSGFKNSFAAQNITNSQYWTSGSNMAPFDKEFHIVLGVSAGGMSDFPNRCKTGTNRVEKPWSNTSPKGELFFYKKLNDWHRTWRGDDVGLKVDYVRVWAL